jgi:hypothetical protein
MIALDGADGLLLNRWTADGTLPNLAALRSRSRSMPLKAPRGSTDDAIWASFKYGVGPGEHGRYHWRQRLRSGRMGMAFLDEAGRNGFWNRLSADGRRVAVLDIPKCGDPAPLNGIHLVDWLVHGRYFRVPKGQPESLAGEVVSRFGPAPPSRCGYRVPALGDDEVREVVRNLRTSAARKRAAGLHYLPSEPWDLFMIGFKEAHCAGHHLWDLSDPDHAGFDASRTARLSDPIRTIYEDLDAAAGELIAAAGDGAGVIVFSTTEMVPSATLDHLLPEIVDRLNRRLGESAGLESMGGSSGRFRRFLPRRRCDMLPYNDNSGALRLILRRSLIRFARPEDKDRLSDQVISLLRGLRDIDTGRPVVVAIDRPSSEQPGRRAAALPDLLLHYEPGIIPRAVESPELGHIEAEPPELRPGNHAAGGFLMAAGPPFSRLPALERLRGMEDIGAVAAAALEN